MSLVYNRTPLIHQYFPGRKSMPQFFLKWECFQPSGSFKSRGIGNLILKNATRISKAGKRRVEVFASSGGNAGLAAATAAKSLSLPCTVVVPTATKARMIEKIRNTGATVIVNGAYWKEADQFLKNSIMNNINKDEVEPIYAHPFDNPDIWEGHSSMVDEIVDDMKAQNVSLDRVKAIVCSVGGGGLLNGIIQGLEKYNLAQKIPIVGVETKGSHVFNTSLKTGNPVEFAKLSSIATSLCTANISDKAFENAIKYGTKSLVLDDIDVLETCLKFTHARNIVTEPACGAAIHLGYHPELLEQELGKKLNENDVVIIVACGGSSNTVSDMEDMLARLKKERQLGELPHLYEPHPSIENIKML